MTIVLVTHEPDIVAYTQRQVLFRDGRIIRDEPVANPRVAINEWKALNNADALGVQSLPGGSEASESK